MLVFLHGFNGNKELWLSTVFPLRSTHGVLIPDLPGHGASDNPENGDYRLEAYASAITELLLAEGITNYCLVGSSMGCAVAANLIRGSVSNIHALFFISPFGITERQIRKIRNFRKGTNSPFIVKDIDDYKAFFQTVVHKPLRIPGWVKYYLAIDHIRRNEHIEVMFDALVTSNECLSTLQKERIPLIVLAGRADVVVDTDCFTFLENQLYDCQLHWLSNIGHLPMLEAPKRLATAIQYLLPCSLTNRKYYLGDS
ncbi:alpha/beta hydrolase [Idiomarina sp. Sol25]|uniref:alpha/beta fold hydrolase n=1 Tax=Idiomarina sp. Sol25 TaxID=3064000 RepID=UPI00294B0276|nr:alpha/beta hydrolase [Idiomarina sp. Sol25]